MLGRTPKLGMLKDQAEADVLATRNRDYARVTILPDAETVMRLLPGWFEDYNSISPALWVAVPLTPGDRRWSA